MNDSHIQRSGPVVQDMIKSISNMFLLSGRNAKVKGGGQRYILNTQKNIISHSSHCTASSSTPHTIHQPFEIIMSTASNSQTITGLSLIKSQQNSWLYPYPFSRLLFFPTIFFSFKCKPFLAGQGRNRHMLTIFPLATKFCLIPQYLVFPWTAWLQRMLKQNRSCWPLVPP